MLQKLFEIHEQTVAHFNKPIKRFLYGKINWKVNALCIYGARGTGKTTLMVQYYYEKYHDVNKALYISADHIHVAAHSLYEIADAYFKYGGQALLIDEIHKYPNWSAELKNIIDVYGDRKIIFSGSSSLNLTKGIGDLSRRAVYYSLPGLSFREFLEFETGKSWPFYSLERILKKHVQIASRLKEQFRILRLFKDYLKYGYYPFFLEGKDEYANRLHNVIEKILYEDLSVVFNIRQTKIPVIKKLLWLIASAPSFIPNVDRLSRELGISREYVYHYLEYLEKSGLLLLVKRFGKGFNVARKPAKVFLQNPNMIHILSEETNYARLSGALRESFFANQMYGMYPLSIPAKGDFVVKNALFFEIGGKNKDFTQIQDMANAYLAVDDIEIGFGKKIPLYLFGFLY